MRSLRISIRNRRGFTLIEVLVVLGIFSLLGSLALFASMDSYRGYAFRSDRDMLVTVLQKARSQSMSNICIGGGCTTGKSHGVAIRQGSYLVFQGTSSTTRDQSADEVVAMSYGGMQIATSSATEIVFAQLSGDVAATGTVTFFDAAGHSSAISVSDEGRISWTN